MPGTGDRSASVSRFAHNVEGDVNDAVAGDGLMSDDDSSMSYVTGI
jgi:hypothetical protein